MHMQRLTVGIVTFHFWFYIMQEYCIQCCFCNDDLCIVPVFAIPNSSLLFWWNVVLSHGCSVTVCCRSPSGCV